MFNKKLKERIKALENELIRVTNAYNEACDVRDSLQDVVEAQGTILIAFSDFIVGTTKTKKKGKKNGK